MTTVLIEDYALLRVAIQHVLERVRNADEILAISPAHLLTMSSSINKPVELLVVGCSGSAEQDIGLLSQAMAFFMPRLVLVLYSALDPSVMAACARAGVAGYLPKASSPDALAAAVSLVIAGGECYPQPAGRPPGTTHSSVQELRELTQRQEEILQLLVQGKTMREIGQQVGISVATVKSHARTLYWKLNARNQAEAAYIAVQMGLVRNTNGQPTPDKGDAS
ncbi:response regulator transcription factor [Achromobacter sp. NFACC18-2]|uniref:response regulator transcription factor n=1 Tax=Achromobacter sp. NFACC18-2 TaxID=1564112 RepID=UPI0008C95C30|nr:response regulator transcription factor [Achromobacter sp. NFACC18-2]SEJ90424.1 DNA-binding response regulator, NarL/FixJ family, contains REC and HTH domains [Achromobacter sp. NFACC18-2]